MYKNQMVIAFSAIALFCAAVLLVHDRGNSNRIFASGQSVVTVDAQEKTFAIWQQHKVKGRILLLFDNYPHAKGLYFYKAPPLLTSYNLVEYSIFQNLIRKVYLVVPDQEWEQFRNKKEMGVIRDFADAEKGVYLYYRSGIPVIATPLSSLPHIPEKPLIYINTTLFSLEQTTNLLKEKQISSDIIVLLRGENR